MIEEEITNPHYMKFNDAMKIIANVDKKVVDARMGRPARIKKSEEPKAVTVKSKRKQR